MFKDATAYTQLIEFLSDCSNREHINTVLFALLTDKEQAEINNRIRIFQLLNVGMTQRDISEQLGVGIATVSRGAKAYQQHQVGEWIADLNSRS